MGIFIAGLVAVASASLFFSTIVYAPALDFGLPGQVHFQEQAIAAGTEQLVCFDATKWDRLCPGQTMLHLTPVNVSDRNAVTIDLHPHTISTPMATGMIAPKCRSIKVPPGLAPGVWRMSGHAANSCSTFGISTTVYSEIPPSNVVIKSP